MKVPSSYSVYAVRFAHRLESLGIRVGRKVTKISSQLMRGPVTVRVDNSQVVIGFGMAKKILVETAS